MSGSTKDFEELVLNPITGKLDMVTITNFNKIVTAERNSAGIKFVTYNPDSGQFIEDGPRVVIDLNGNVVTV